MSADFVKMMWRRIQFMGEVLKLGYSFLVSVILVTATTKQFKINSYQFSAACLVMLVLSSTSATRHMHADLTPDRNLYSTSQDADIIWFRDPFAVFKDNFDFQISTDHYKGYNARPIASNTGFLYVRSNQRTIAMYKYWHEARLTHLKQNDQMVLNEILREPDFQSVGVTIEYYTTDYFSGFCMESKDMTKVVTMHSNCCIGLSNKLSDLRMSLEDWNLYRSNSNNSTDIRQPEWRAPRSCQL